MMTICSKEFLIVKPIMLGGEREAKALSEGTALNPHFPQNEDKCLGTVHRIKPVMRVALP